MRKDLKYWIAFNQNLKIGPQRFKKLYGRFRDIKEAWNAPQKDLARAGVDPEIVSEIQVMQNQIDPDRELEKIQELDITAVTVLDEEYPKELKEIVSAPALLYVKGNLEALQNSFKVAVVGTRRPTTYGREATYQIARDLALNDITIVSGLALGVDAIAHQAAVDGVKNTIAVLGCGLDKIYPTSNQHLGNQIIENGGAIVSEYPIATPPYKQHFPARNRIISGLSKGVVVTEAADRSGALITAMLALEQNRDVFALPGSIFNKNSLGPNNLIKMGAKLVASGADVLTELDIESAADISKARKIYPDTKEEAVILEILQEEPHNIDLIIQKSDLDASLINTTLTLMEVKGKVRNLGNMTYAIKF